MKTLQTLCAGAISLSILPLVAVQAEAQTQTLLIDNFNSGAVDVFLNGAAPQSSSGSVSGNPGDIIGGDRNYSINKFAGSSGSANASALTIDGVGNSTLSISNGAGGANSTTTIQYLDLGVNVSSPYNAIGFEIVDYDQPGGTPVNIAVTLLDGLGGTSTVSLPVLNDAPPTFNILFPFDSFVGVDFTNIDDITVQFSGSAGYDITIEELEFTTVPEPTTMLATGLAFGLGTQLLKRKKGSNKG